MITANPRKQGKADEGKDKTVFQNERHLQSLNAQVNEIKRIYKHYSDGKLLTRDGFGTLLRSICTDEHTEEILTYLVIGNKVNFGQFLSVIPLLLENYDNLMFHEKWILSRISYIFELVTGSMKNYEFSDAGMELLSFTRNEFCDYCIEEFKVTKEESIF